MFLRNQSGPRELSHYWAALISGATPTDMDRLATPLSGETRHIATAMRALRDDFRPDPAFVESLESRLTGLALATPAPAISPRLRSQRDEVWRRLPVSWQAGWLHQPYARLAAAALLAIVVVLAAGVFREIQRDHDNRPAILAPSTPEATDTVDAQIIIPAGAWPTEGIQSAGIEVFTIPVGTNSTWAQTCCPGPLIEYVVAGSYTVRAAAPIQVARADGSTEDVAANVDVTLGPGDSLISRSETPVEATNAGTEPVQLLSFAAVQDDHSFDGHRLAGWQHGSPYVRRDFQLEPGPVTVRIRRITVMNGEAVPPPTTGYIFVTPLTKDGFVVGHSDGSIQVFGEVGKSVDAYIVTLSQVGAERATPAP